MPIYPLQQFETDVEADRRAALAERLRAAGVPEEQADRLSELPEDDLRVYKKLAAPKTIVVRYSFLYMVGEFPYRGSDKPGCGSKLVVSTHRGTEIGEMLTSTCPNSGCSKSVSRQEMLEYIDNSGGRQYPFRTDGKVLRVATKEDLDEQSRLEQSKHALRTEAKRLVAEARLPLKNPLKIVEVEPILGDERLTVYYTCEDRVDPVALNDILRPLHHRRVDVRQVGARDEARISADYEKCGQYCCCKNFLKVLKPVSMKSAKVQKATLDPLKISGRCGRLMCCLRYEDETYEDLRKRLPNRKKRVGTPEGDGIVLDTQILTQLALVRLDAGEDRAFPVEELTDPENAKAPERPEPRMRSERKRRDDRPARPDRPTKTDRADRPDHRSDRADKPDRRREEPRDATPSDTATDDKPRRKRKRRKKPVHTDPAQATNTPNDTPQSEPPRPGASETDNDGQASADAIDTGASPTRKKRRRKRKRRGEGDTPTDTSTPSPDTPQDATPNSDTGSEPPRPGSGSSDGTEPSPAKKKRRRKRKRRNPGGRDDASNGNVSDES
jgi:cell fate regulator YaaT (PSP1 superfamily)